MRFRFNFLYIVFLLGIVFFIPMTKKIISSPEEFYGIAENQIRSINLQYPVEIKEIKVALGEKIDSGQLLARLYRTDLPIKINDINYEIRELQVKRWMDIEQQQAEASKLEAKKAALAVTFDQKIAQLETENAAQLKVLSGIKTLDMEVGTNTGVPDIRLQRILSLKKEKQLEIKQLDVQLAQIHAEIELAQAPIDLRIKKLEGELELIKKQEAELELFAPQSGIVGQLDFMPGEKIEAYTIILRIYGIHSDLVTTYIGDGRLAEIKLGDTLMVSSINQPEYQVPGVVLGLGTRIKELPERLRRIPELKAWGREVQLQIPLNNSFLQGEKVKVTMNPGKVHSIF
jgi:multidrug resistance efflux pump